MQTHRTVPMARRAAPPERPRSFEGHARRIRPARVTHDGRRLLTAGSSAVIPGLGQLVNGRPRLALVFALPFGLALLVVVPIALLTPPLRLAARLVDPSVLDILLTLNVVLLAWRLVAVGQAFLDGRFGRLPGRKGVAGLALIVAFVSVPHLAAYAYGSAARDTFATFFDGTAEPAVVGGGTPATPAVQGPGPNERLNVLLVGFDSTASRTEKLTDSMMLVSIDPDLGSASILSIPRDMIGVPLGDGRTYGPKLNSLYSYAAAHPKDFPDGPIGTLQDAVGALLGIRVQYYATADFANFTKLIDAVGGVDINVDHGFKDPRYNGTGYSITAGPHHFDGTEALAFARSRYAPTESDFTRAARQQQILVALKQKLIAGGTLLFRLPDLLRTLGGFVHTDLPPDRLPDLAALADTSAGATIERVVIGHPLVKGALKAPYGSVQIPDLPAILALAKELLPPPGTAPAASPSPLAPASPKP